MTERTPAELALPMREDGPALAREFDAMPATLQREAWARLRERVEERERVARAEVA